MIDLESMSLKLRSCIMDSFSGAVLPGGPAFCQLALQGENFHCSLVHHQTSLTSLINTYYVVQEI